MNLSTTSVAFLLTLMISGCGKEPVPPKNSEALPKAVVRVVEAQIRPRVAIEEVVGTVQPKLRSSISPKISGVIEQMLAAPGQQVKAGDLLVRISAAELRAKQDQAIAVRDQAKKDIARFETLLKENALTQQEFDAAQARFRVAEATVAETETMLGYAKITAPFDGVITVKHADVGDFAAPGKSLLEMEDPSKLRFEADVPDALMNKVKLGDKLPVRLSGDKVIDGVVGEIAPVADAVSRTFRVKMDLSTSSDMRSGQFGRVAVPVSTVDALRVPVSALVVRGQLEIVFIVTNQQAQLRLVKTGKRIDSEVEIVSGLSNGERLVVDGADKLVDGQPVELNTTAQ